MILVERVKRGVTEFATSLLQRNPPPSCDRHTIKGRHSRIARDKHQRAPSARRALQAKRELRIQWLTDGRCCTTDKRRERSSISVGRGNRVVRTTTIARSRI